jgi:hypothetical protein
LTCIYFFHKFVINVTGSDFQFFRKRNIKSIRGEMKKTGLFVIIAFFVSCVPIKYNIKPDSKIEELSICIYYADDIPENVKAAFNKITSDYCFDYNHEQHEFKLSPSDDSTHSAFKIYISGTKFVRPGEQVLVSALYITAFLLELSSPSGHMLDLHGPWGTARDISRVNLELTDDITFDQSTHSKVISNSGWYIF